MNVRIVMARCTYAASAASGRDDRVADARDRSGARGPHDQRTWPKPSNLDDVRDVEGEAAIASPHAMATPQVRSIAPISEAASKAAATGSGWAPGATFSWSSR